MLHLLARLMRPNDARSKPLPHPPAACLLERLEPRLMMAGDLAPLATLEPDIPGAADVVVAAQAAPTWGAATPQVDLGPINRAGWTVLERSADSHVIYVSSSTGDDAHSGTRPDQPLRTLAAAIARLRPDSPDWLLLKRGDVWDESLGWWNLSGRSVAEPMVIGAYGQGPRPLLRTMGESGLVHTSMTQPLEHLRIVGIHFDAFDTPRQDFTGIGIRLLNAHGVLIEDCMVRGYTTNITLQGSSDVAVRRSTIVDAYASGRHSQGLFADRTHGILLDGNVFDHNGWREGVTEPTIFNHNIYITAKSSPIIARGNILSRAAATGLQARPGGIIEKNLFLRNPIAMTFGLVYGNDPVAGGVSGRVTDNIVLESTDIGDAVRRFGFQFANINSDGLLLKGNYIGPATGGGGTGVEFNAGNGIGLHQVRMQGNVIQTGLALRLVADLRQNLTGFPFVGSIAVENNDLAGSRYIASQRSNVEGFEFDPRSLTFSQNRYRAAGEGPFERIATVAGRRVTQVLSEGEWSETVTSTSNRIAAPDGANRLRELDDYQARMDLTPGFGAFMAFARGQMQGRWDHRYTASSILHSIKAAWWEAD